MKLENGENGQFKNMLVKVSSFRLNCAVFNYYTRQCTCKRVRDLM